MSKTNHRTSSARTLADIYAPATAALAAVVEKAKRRDKAVPKRAAAVASANVEVKVPKVGDTVTILHGTDPAFGQDKVGDFIDLKGRLKRTTDEQRTIKRLYLSDAEGYRIQDSAGEVWTIALGHKGWQSVNPEHEARNRG